MNRKTITLSLVLALVALVALPAVAGDHPSAPKPVTKTEVQTLTAKITAIDAAKRLITLTGPKGNSVTLEASAEVKRFSELKVGDEVTIKYTETFVARLAKPGEVAEASGTIARSEGAKPGGEAKAKATIVVTLLDVDPAVPSVTIKTPEGDVKTFHIKDKKNLEGFKAGDKVAITYGESLAIDVAPPAKK